MKSCVAGRAINEGLGPEQRHCFCSKRNANKASWRRNISTSLSGMRRLASATTQS